MAYAYENGWDFIKVGETYQYKEGALLCDLMIVEDNSTDTHYKFKVRVVKSNMLNKDFLFDVEHIKKSSGYYSGMMQFFKEKAYIFSDENIKNVVTKKAREDLKNMLKSFDEEE